MFLFIVGFCFLVLLQPTQYAACQGSDVSCKETSIVLSNSQKIIHHVRNIRMKIQAQVDLKFLANEELLLIPWLLGMSPTKIRQSFWKTLRGLKSNELKKTVESLYVKVYCQQKNLVPNP